MDERYLVQKRSVDDHEREGKLVDTEQQSSDEVPPHLYPHVLEVLFVVLKLPLAHMYFDFLAASHTTNIRCLLTVVPKCLRLLNFSWETCAHEHIDHRIYKIHLHHYNDLHWVLKLAILQANQPTLLIQRPYNNTEQNEHPYCQ